MKLMFLFVFPFVCAAGEGMMEVTVFRGKNLVPKDSNGRAAAASSVTLIYLLSVSLSLSQDLVIPTLLSSMGQTQCSELM